jgi:hypothetical protein
MLRTYSESGAPEGGHRFRIRRDPKWLLCKAQFNEKLSAQHIENIMTKQSEAKRV